MSNLLYKELRLAAHPTLFVFIFLGAMVLIPSYPYTVVFLYGCLGPFITAFYGRQTNDVYFTALLPLKKSDVVKGKILLTVFAQVAMFIFSIPFAFISPLINPNGGNIVGIDANFAYYGFGFIILAVFDFIFLTQFYKTAYKAGVAFIWAIIPTTVLMVAVETSVHIPGLKWLDGVDKANLLKQLPILIVGLLIYVGGLFLTDRVASKNFAKVDL